MRNRYFYEILIHLSSTDNLILEYMDLGQIFMDRIILINLRRNQE